MANKNNSANTKNNENSDDILTKLTISKAANYLTALKQLSHRCIVNNCAEVERSFYIKQIKNIFLQILQPVFEQQKLLQEQEKLHSNKSEIEQHKSLIEKLTKIIFDTNFILKVIIQENVINHPAENYKENENLIISQLENCIQTIDFVDTDRQQCELVMISVPILSWSSYGVPRGNISNLQSKKIAEILKTTIASKESKAIVLVNYLFGKDEIPNSYLSTAQLTNSILDAYLIMHSKNDTEKPTKTKKAKKTNNDKGIYITEVSYVDNIEIQNDAFSNANKNNGNSNNNSSSNNSNRFVESYDENEINYISVDDECSELTNRGDISEVKFMLAAIIVPKNKSVFSWMDVDKKTNLLFSRNETYIKWEKRISPVLKDIFKGCNSFTILPETLFDTLQPAIVISRRYGLEALLKYLRSIIGIIPTQLCVLIAGFYYYEKNQDEDDSDSSNDNENNDDESEEINEELKEFRLSFKVRGASQILCGYTWDLLNATFNDNDIEEEENLSEIMEILKKNNILDIRVIDNHFEYCVCSNCMQRLYVNDDNELIHPKLPEQLVFNKPN